MCLLYVLQYASGLDWNLKLDIYLKVILVACIEYTYLKPKRYLYDAFDDANWIEITENIQELDVPTSFINVYLKTTR